MVLNITHRLELQELLLLDTNTETGVGLDQDFVKPQGINSDVFYQTGIRGDRCRVGAGNAMQDLDEAAL